MRHRPTLYARQGGTKVHVVALLREAIEAGYPGATGACGAIVHGPEYLARMVPEAERCQSAACRRLWPAHLRVVG
jgi:hypothetical protein